MPLHRTRVAVGRRLWVWFSQRRELRLSEIELRIVIEDRLMETLEIRARFETQVLDQQPSCLAIDLERFGLTPGPIERKHLLGTHPLSQRVLANQFLQLDDHSRVLPQRQVGIDPLLGGDQSELLEAFDLEPRERFELEVGEWSSTPKRLRLTKRLRRSLERSILKRSVTF